MQVGTYQRHRVTLITKDIGSTGSFVFFMGSENKTKPKIVFKLLYYRPWTWTSACLLVLKPIFTKASTARRKNVKQLQRSKTIAILFLAVLISQLWNKTREHNLPCDNMTTSCSHRGRSCPLTSANIVKPYQKCLRYLRSALIKQWFWFACMRLFWSSALREGLWRFEPNRQRSFTLSELEELELWMCRNVAVTLLKTFFTTSHHSSCRNGVRLDVKVCDVIVLM